MSDRPSFHQICMGLAETLAKRSTCVRLNVGCVITTTDFRKILSWGYNGNVSGGPNDCDRKGEAAVGNCGCFPLDTRIEATAIQRAYRRWYEGLLVRVTTDHEEFTATPNHPVLTLGRGWVPLNLLAEGDYVLCSCGTERVLTDAPDDKHDVALEEAFEALRVAGLGHVRHSGARHHFHGDGLIEQDVDVVSVDCGLTPHRKAGVLQFTSEPVLATALKVQSLLTSQRPLQKRFFPSGFSRASIGLTPIEESSFRESLANHRTTDAKDLGDLVGGLSTPVPRSELVGWKLNHGLSLVTAEILGDLSKNARFSEAVLNRCMRDPIGLSHLEHSLTGLVTAHKVLRVERYRWSGHVGTLQTASGWYSLQLGGIIVKNCIHAETNAIVKCDAPPYVDKVVFCTTLPCVACAKLIIQLGGVKEVYYRNDYRIKESLVWLNRAHILAGHYSEDGMSTALAHIKAAGALTAFLDGQP